MKFIRTILYIVSITVFVSCVSGGQNDFAENDAYKDVVLGEDLARIGMPEKLDYLISNLVISDEMIGLLAQTDKNLYDQSLLNSVENVKYYNTSKNKAVNMGVYGADLNYLIHFEQPANSMRYMSASKQLADQIGVAMSFDQQVVEEYQNNAENKDSLINVIFVVYDNARRMLKNEEQFMLSSLVIVGSWIENMYITTELFQHTKSTTVKSRLVTSILEQKDYLEKILEAVVLLDEGDNIFVTDIIEDLKSVDAQYQGFGDKLLSEDDVKALQQNITKVRTKIIQVK